MITNNFWGLIKKFKIEIPKIQRDYAQGRESEKKIAQKFIDDIHDALVSDKHINLDFIYGKTNDDILVPIDGQQRLTTLFLLHWYLGAKERKLNDDNKNILSRFTYEIRLSSQDFCDKLVKESIDFKTVNDKLSEAIKNSKWFFLAWIRDPTVEAMLNMLDLIHRKFKNEDELFEILTDGKNSRITFNFLPLEKFNLTDELYIKMNARGKSLTEFEHFKSNFSEYLDNDNKSKLDNEWMDVFWKLESENNGDIYPENVDKKFFNFFENLTLNFYVEKHRIKEDEEFKNKDIFDIYREVYKNKNNVDNAIKILDSLIDYTDEDKIFLNFLKPDKIEENEDNEKDKSINYWERVRFYALMQFFIRYGRLTDKNERIYKRWIRVTKNLINNTRIEGMNDLYKSIKATAKLSNQMKNIYEYIENNENFTSFFLREQQKEESLKAKLILKNHKWEPELIRAEKHWHLDGQIGFLLKFADNNFNDFIKYRDKFIKLFRESFEEIDEDYNYQTLIYRALLAEGNYLPEINSNLTFCNFETSLRAKIDNWRQVFKDNEKEQYLKKLLDDISVEHIEKDLKKIIYNYDEGDWRKYFIKNPEYIRYCKNRQIRWISENEIYLLRKSQMNGKHVELRSYDFCCKQFKSNNQEGCIEEGVKLKVIPPFTETWYWESTSWDPPCIVLDNWKYKRSNFGIDVGHFDGSYYLRFWEENEKKFPEEIVNKLIEIGFKKDDKEDESALILKINEDIAYRTLYNKIIKICNDLEKLS